MHGSLNNLGIPVVTTGSSVRHTNAKCMTGNICWKCCVHDRRCQFGRTLCMHNRLEICWGMLCAPQVAFLVTKVLSVCQEKHLLEILYA